MRFTYIQQSLYFCSITLMHSESPEDHNLQQSSPNPSPNKQGLEGRWTPDEHVQFLKGVIIHGKDWKKIDEMIATRTGSQVRSHAQKYFLKIAKINKERRRHKNKSIQLTQTQQQILDMFTQSDITQNTPQQISSIIRKQTTVSGHHHSKYKIKSEIHNTKTNQYQNSTKNKKNKVSQQQTDKQKSFTNQSLWNIPHLHELQECEQQHQEMNVEDKNNYLIKKFLNCKIEEEEDQDQSYFIHLVKKNMNHFCNGGEFSDLIDFGKSVQAQETSPRKLSFTAVESEQRIIQQK